jgi:hypothetical protein
MGTAAPIGSQRQQQAGRVQGYTDDDELGALREENKQLRELVIQLSKLVVRNVLERK